MHVCKRCIMDENIPNITFDSTGICSYCHLHDKMVSKYPTKKEGEKIIKKIVNRIKEKGKKKKYDCVIGVSGGCDSSFLLYNAKKWGLRILAVTFDNTWSTIIANNNINNMCDNLDIELYTYVVDGEEFNDISRSFLYASVPDADIPNDIAIASLYYRVMNEFDVDFSLCGHSFRTEGTVPIGWTYMDGKYIKSVHEKFGKIPMKTFLNLDIDYWLKNIHRKRIRLLYYLDYNKEQVKDFLHNNFKWEWYGGHHHENVYTKFVKSFLLPKKFGIDKRYIEFSALVRSNNMSREEALDRITTFPEVESNFIKYVLKRLDLTKEEMNNIMNLPIKSHKDYETYREYFIKNRNKFCEMAEKGLVSRTFYEKYTM